ncbi:hypothetical protein J6590_078884 [Homalodisca vitripennis]|nr:hypothetical protein J6590_078884 [Homalodisca vitripennis]
MSYAEVKIIPNNSIENWTCLSCKESLEDQCSSINNEKNSSINNLEDKLSLISNFQEINLEKSLTLATEVGTALLQENDELRQQLDVTKFEKSYSELEESSKQIQKLVNEANEKEKDLMMRIEVLENKIKQERKIRKDLIHQSDTEKTELKAKLNYFEKQNRNLENFDLANTQTEYLEEKLKQCNTVNLELNTNISNLKSEIQILKYPCKTCINYKEEIKNMTERLKVFEQENQSLLIINEENQILQKENEALKNEVTNLQTVIKVLQADNNNEDPTPPSKESSFTVPRKTFKAAVLPNNSRLIELKNSFNILNKIDNGNSETLNVFNMRDFPPLSTKNTTSTELQSKVLILSDSHGKNLFRGVQSRSFGNVTVITRPGAPLQHVTGDIEQLTHGFTANDYVVVIGGTNDVGKKQPNSIVNQLIEVHKFTKHTNLILATLTMRHDKPHLDEQISHINDNLMKWSTGAEAVSILPLHRLPRHFYTKHGLHLNKLGKEKICQMVVGATREMRQHRMVLEHVAAELKNPSGDIVLHQLPQTSITSRAVLHDKPIMKKIKCLKPTETQSSPN